MVPVLALLTVAVWFLSRPPASGALEMAGVAFLASFGLTPCARLVALGVGALDRPDPRKRHSQPTPKLGGVAVLSAFVLALGRRALSDREMLAIALAALVLMLAGAADDTRGLSARLRLCLQLACAGVVISSGVRLNLLPGTAGAAVNVALSFLWIVGLTNAFNFIDGMDGLAASLGSLIAVLLALVARANGQAGLVAVCSALGGALLGFLPHNLRPGGPATIFLGDSGSASVGFLLAALAIKEDWAVGDPLVALATPVLIFSVLIYDMIQTTISRLASGRVTSFRGWIDYVGRDHIHHRFTAVLGGEKPALVLILTLALGLGLSALGLRQGSSGQALIFILHGVLILLAVTVLETAARRARITRRPTKDRG